MGIHSDTVEKTVEYLEKDIVADLGYLEKDPSSIAIMIDTEYDVADIKKKTEVMKESFTEFINTMSVEHKNVFEMMKQELVKRYDQNFKPVNDDWFKAIACTLGFIPYKNKWVCYLNGEDLETTRN